MGARTIFPGVWEDVIEVRYVERGEFPQLGKIVGAGNRFAAFLCRVQRGQKHPREDRDDGDDDKQFD